MAVQKRQMVVDLHECGNGYKKICKWFNIPLRIVRAIIKKFKRYGTVENLMGRGRNCILPPRILSRMVREATKSPRITVKELQALVASWDHQVSKRQPPSSDTTSITTASLEGLPEKSLFWPQDTEETAWNLPNVLYIMTRTRCSGQMRPKLKVFVRHSICIFGVGTEIHTRRSTSCPQWNMVVGQSCFGAVLIPEIQGHWLGLMA